MIRIRGTDICNPPSANCCGRDLRFRGQPKVRVYRILAEVLNASLCSREATVLPRDQSRSLRAQKKCPAHESRGTLHEPMGQPRACKLAARRVRCDYSGTSTTSSPAMVESC